MLMLAGLARHFGAENESFGNGEFYRIEAQDLTNLNGASGELNVARFNALSEQECR